MPILHCCKSLGGVQIRRAAHSSVAIAEMMNGIGRLDPRHPGTTRAASQIGAVIKAMPAHRTFLPDLETIARAALLSGALSRMMGHAADDRRRAFNDCILFMQGLRLGVTVLTRNIADFDLLAQMVPAGRVLFYRRSEGV